MRYSIWEKILIRAWHPSTSERQKVHFNLKKFVILMKIECLDREICFYGIAFFAWNLSISSAIFGTFEISNLLLCPRSDEISTQTKRN